MGQIPAHIQYEKHVAIARRRRVRASMPTLISIGVVLGLASFAMVLVGGLVG
jgi:hypothetical protein